MKTARLSALLAALFPFTLGSAAAPADPQAPTAGKVIELKLPGAVSMKF